MSPRSPCQTVAFGSAMPVGGDKDSSPPGALSSPAPLCPFILPGGSTIGQSLGEPPVQSFHVPLSARQPIGIATSRLLAKNARPDNADDHVEQLAPTGRCVRHGQKPDQPDQKAARRHHAGSGNDSVHSESERRHDYGEAGR